MLLVFGVVVQLVRIPACHAGGRGFESRPFRQFNKFLHYIIYYTNRGVVQLVEHRSPKPGVGSSILSAPAIIKVLFINNLPHYKNSPVRIVVFVWRKCDIVRKFNHVVSV